MDKIVCCVGDGGNDVGMIHNASIGIGIQGNEGNQASLASDISIKKFSDLTKLILWHGRLCFMRTSILANFVIHKGVILAVIQCIYMTIFHFITLSIYNGYLKMGYATLFTMFAVFSLILDVDIPFKQVY